MKFIELPVFDAKSSGLVLIDLERIEVLVDLENLGHLGSTQITMQSGTKFFVKSTYQEIKQLVNKYSGAIL